MFMLATKTQISNFVQNLLTTLRKNNFDEEENIIIGGDFNCPPHPILDRKGGLLIPRKSVVTTIEDLQEELDLVDIWRVKNPERKSFYMEPKFSNDFLLFGLLANFKHLT